MGGESPPTSYEYSKMEIFTTTQMTGLLTTVWNGISSNLIGVLIVLGFTVGLSIVLSLINWAVGYDVKDVFGNKYRMR